MLPSLSLTRSTGPDLSIALSDPVGVFSVGASILAPIFNRGLEEVVSGISFDDRRQASQTGSRGCLRLMGMRGPIR